MKILLFKLHQFHINRQNTGEAERNAYRKHDGTHVGHFHPTHSERMPSQQAAHHHNGR